MPPTAVRVVVVLALVVVAVAAAYVESMGLRVALVVVPALFLTQQALAAAGAAGGKDEAASIGVEEAARRLEEDRRSDLAVRRHIRQLLELIRDFYSTCHMVAVGQLSPAKAKARARDVEEKLNEIMKDMLDRVAEAEADGSTIGDGASAEGAPTDLEET